MSEEGGTRKDGKTVDSKAEDGELVEEEVFKLPEDLVSSVKPCEYLETIYQQPVIIFEEPGNRVNEFLKVVRYSDIPNFLDIPITTSYKMFINAFNEMDRKQINKPPENIADYANYISTLFPQKSCFQIAVSWPPGLPRIFRTMEPIAAILIKMLGEVDDPAALLRFLSVAIFPKIWSKNSCAKDEILDAISPCKFHGKEDHWAYLRDREWFNVVHIGKSGDVVSKAGGVVNKFVRSKDKESIIARGKSGKICDFTPMDPNVIPLWIKIFRDKNDGDGDEQEEENELPKEIPLVFYMTKDSTHFPDVLYHAFYEALVANDLVIVRTLMLMNSPYPIVKSLLKASLYSGKNHLVFGAVVGRMLEPDDLNPMSIYSEDSFYRKFVHALWESYGEQYIIAFLRRIIALIDRHSGFDEKLFFTVVKYITRSAHLLPIPIRHFASVIRSYACAKFNSRGMCYILMGGFLGLDFICPVIAHPEKYMKTLSMKIDKRIADKEELELKHPNILKTVSDNLQYLFHGALLPDSFKDLNRRIQKHTILEMEEFLFSLGDIDGEIPQVSPPSQEELVIGLTKIMHFVLEKPETLRKTYDEAAISQSSYPPQIGWNFASLMSSFFRHVFDIGYKKNKITGPSKIKPNPLKFPPLPMYGIIPSKARVGGASSVSGFGFDNKSVTERKIVTTSSSPAPMKLPSKPKNPFHNPIDSKMSSDKL